MRNLEEFRPCSLENARFHHFQGTYSGALHVRAGMILQPQPSRIRPGPLRRLRHANETLDTPLKSPQTRSEHP